MWKVTVLSSGLPSIVPSPETVRVNIERSMQLPCRAIGHPPPVISWKRDGVPIEQLGSRFSVLPDGTLLITSTVVP